jgi:glycerol-3-phosphate dehydrogenase subunit C
MILASTDIMGGIATKVAPVANFALSLKPTKVVMDAVLKVDKHRTFPKYTSKTFESWYRKSVMAFQDSFNHHVSFFHGCYVNYNYPQLGKDLISVMNALGYGVHLLDKEKCCGTALISNCMIDQAKKNAVSNLESIRKSVYERQMPVIGTSSSCNFTIRDEYPHLLGIDNSDVRNYIELATRFIYRLIEVLLDDNGKHHTVEEIRTTLKNMNVTDEFNAYYKSLYTGSSTLTDLVDVLDLPLDHQYYQAADLKKMIKKLQR